ncbi:MAG: 5'-3' exonuclease H3TH domain-containing protein [Candidatus Methylomirabilales bacterium]
MHLYLIDGSSYIYRAFFALPPLSNSRGLPTNAIYGFTNMLLKVLRQHAPEHVAVVFDAGGETERHREFEAYKAQRPPMPDTLAPQIPYIYEVVEALHVPTLMEEGYEADDIIGTVATRAATDGFQVTIVSGDKDLFQLVGPAIQVYDPMRDKTYGAQAVEERYGVPPRAMPDLMSLTGDAVDNIPGVPGVGEKTASALIQEFGTVENLLSSLDRVKRPKLREALKSHAEQIRMNRALVTIRTGLPPFISAQALRRQIPDWERLRVLFREFEFMRLLGSLEEPGQRTL